MSSIFSEFATPHNWVSHSINSNFAIRLCEFWENKKVKNKKRAEKKEKCLSGWGKWHTSWKWQHVFCLVVEEGWKDFMWISMWMPAGQLNQNTTHLPGCFPLPGLSHSQALPKPFCPAWGHHWNSGWPLLPPPFPLWLHVRAASMANTPCLCLKLLTHWVCVPFFCPQGCGFLTLSGGCFHS